MMERVLIVNFGVWVGPPTAHAPMRGSGMGSAGCQLLSAGSKTSAEAVGVPHLPRDGTSVILMRS
eukprot:COSAG01_NODE_1853_length_9060_cov_13.741576_7_plen_65_part_00